METTLSTLLATSRNYVSKKTDTKHLKLRGNIWWYQRRVPKHLTNQYPNQSFIQASLDTADVRQARRKRDILNGELEERVGHRLVCSYWPVVHYFFNLFILILKRLYQITQT